MFTQRNKRIASLLAFGAAMLLGQSAYAVGIASGTSVQNDVVVDYSVGGSAQPQLSDSVSFLVDNKIDVSVASTDINVVPGTFDQVVTFTIVNEGNTTQGYRLTAALSTVPSTFNATVLRLYVEDGTTPGFQDTDDTLYTSGSAVNAGDLDPNSLVPGADTMIVYLVGNIPNAASNGQVSNFDLLVTTTNAGTATITTDNSSDAWAANSVQVVFAEGAAGPHSSDAANDGEISDTGTYTVVSAALVVTKTQAVISDGFSPAGFEKAIPGAVVRYTITLNNSTGSADAVIPATVGVGVVDDFDETAVTYSASSTDVAITGGGTDNNIADNSNGANTGAFVDTSVAGQITINDFTVPAGETATITFDVTIQ